MKRKLWFIEIAAVILFLTFLSCEGPEGPAGPAGDTQIWVSADIGCKYSWSSVPYATVLIENCPVIPAVSINGTALYYQPGSGNGEVYVGAGNLKFDYDDFDIQPGESAVLEIGFQDDEGVEKSITGEIMLPGDFEITEPADTSITLVWGEDFTFAWTEAQDADGYKVDFYRYLSYTDNLGQDASFNYNHYTNTTSTSITYPASALNPDPSAVTSVFYSSGRFSVIAFSGPAESGAGGNITGDGQGFFYGYTYGGT